MSDITEEIKQRVKARKEGNSETPVATWQPVNTAPRDGTCIDLWTPHGRYVHCFWGKPEHSCGEAVEYCDSDWHSAEPGWVDGTFAEFLPSTPTHWMSIPSAPRGFQ